MAESRGPAALISVSMDLGAGRRGVDMGPSAFRIAGITEVVRERGYTIREAGTVHATAAEIAEVGEGRMRYFHEIADVTRRLHEQVREGLADGCLPLILGGDHSLSIGSVSALARHYRERGESVGLLWIDAHTDMNVPETTPSGNIHGMSLALLVGRGDPELAGIAGDGPALDPERVSVLGARSIDLREREVVRESGVRVFTMSEIDERGLTVCVDEALKRAGAGTAGFHVSFDLDVIDPLVAPGVGTPVAGGLTYREAHLICEKVARSEKLLGLEMVELNPVMDEGNRTARLGVGLVASALGKSIL